LNGIDQNRGTDLYQFFNDFLTSRTGEASVVSRQICQ